MGHIDGHLRNLKKVPQNIGIVTSPGLTTGAIPLSNLIEILHSFSSCPYVITGNKGVSLLEEDSENIHIFKVKSIEGKNKSIFSRIKNNICIQLRVSNKVVKLAGNVDVWIFFFADGLVLPMLIAKLLRKKAVLAFTGSAANVKVEEVEGGPLIKVSAFLQNINYHLSDKIVMYSERLVEEHNMQKYRNKISIAHEHFLDFDKFKVSERLNEGGNLIGYIGRLREIKGVLNFVEAIPTILQERSDIRFLIGGDGPLREKLVTYLCQVCLGDKVTFSSWIPHDELPKYLNELKLLVLPSYTEGLPNIMLEAMACGTPVLATPVGAIPDVIKDEETGFILEDNSSGCIARDVMRVLNYPDLDEIVKNARELVEKEFTYEATVERYRKILDIAMNKGNKGGRLK